MPTTVLAYRIANGPYITTDLTVDLGTGRPSSVEYWDGTAYVTTYSHPYLKPGGLVGLVSASAFPTQGIDMSLMRVLTIASVETSPVAVDWYDPITGARHFNAGFATRVTFTRTLGRAFDGGSSVGQPTYDYLVLLAQTGPTSLEQGLKFFGQTATTGALTLGATTLPVASTWGQFIPVASGGTYPTVDPAILGVDPAPFLATGGRVQIFRPDEACVIHHTINEAPQTVANAQDINLGRTRLAKVRVFGNDGAEITTGFTVNLTTGHIVFTNVAGYSQPVVIRHRIEDMLLVSESLEQSIKVARPLTHDFPSGSRVSSVLMFGDLQARSHPGFGQVTWTGVFSDTLIGSATVADYNEAVNPIAVTNLGALSERWACVFTNSTTFKIIGEQVGEILTGNTGSNAAPLNPATLEPYFTIPAAGWGAGWAAGNVYRFNTDGANAPVWLIRSVAPSDPFVGQDSMTLAIRGSVDA